MTAIASLACDMLPTDFQRYLELAGSDAQRYVINRVAELEAQLGR